jgi:hypothetical protein
MTHGDLTGRGAEPPRGPAVRTGTQDESECAVTVRRDKSVSAGRLLAGTSTSRYGQVERSKRTRSSRRPRRRNCSFERPRWMWYNYHLHEKVDCYGEEYEKCAAPAMHHSSSA